MLFYQSIPVSDYLLLDILYDPLVVLREVLLKALLIGKEPVDSRDSGLNSEL